MSQLPVMSQFDPRAFLGSGWRFLVPHVHINKICVHHPLCGDEHMSGFKMHEYATGSTCKLGDANLFYALWTNKEHIPEEWKCKVDGSLGRFCFFGSILENPGGFVGVLYLIWHPWFDTETNSPAGWKWGCRLLCQEFYSNDHLVWYA